MIKVNEKKTFKTKEIHDILFGIFEHYNDLVLNDIHISTTELGLWYTDFNQQFGFYRRETEEEISMTIELNNIVQINDMFISE